MRQGRSARTEDLLRRLTGEAESRDTLARVARELRRRHDDQQERRRRTSATLRAGDNPRRGVRRSAEIARGVRHAGGVRPRAAR
jgi:hypothetical protein